MIELARLTPHQADHKFLSNAFSRLPDAWAPPVAKTYQKAMRAHGRTAANIAVLDTLDAVSGFKFGVASDDQELREFAKRRAAECFRVACNYLDADFALAKMLEVALRYEIAPPCGRNVTKTGQRMRLLDETWWRRNVRKTAGRNVESAAIKIGLVSRVAGLYASDDAVKRRTGQRRRNREILESIVAINDKGQEYSMQALSDLGTSSPEIRRMELMTRIAGFDQIALTKGHAAEFYTITAPSKYHARHHIHGREQPNYDGYTPADTQKYLTKIWAQIRAKLAREGLMIYGFRVAEPHHDGTPHWHLLMFCQVEHVEAIRAIFKHYAMKEDGHESGADIHRLKYESIDRKRGSAAGYIAKYISKNIDGKTNGGGEIDGDYEALIGEDDATKTARRVDAWASTWGIRQFQQIGGQSVTVYRELRRTDPAEIQGEKFNHIAQAAIDGDWQKYTTMQGGVSKFSYEYPRFSKKTGRALKNGKKSIQVRLVALDKVGAEVVQVESVDYETGEIKTGTHGFNCYGEIMADKILGLSCQNEAVFTHLREWVFKRGGEAVTPRSSLNNCTHFFTVGGKKTEFKEKAEKIQAEKMEKKRFIASRVAISESPAFCLIYTGNEKAEYLTGEDLKRWSEAKILEDMKKQSQGATR